MRRTESGEDGSGTQTLSGGYIYFTGGTTINGGKLVLQDVTNTDFESLPVANYGVLEIDAVYAAFSFNGAIGGSGSLNISGGNTLTLAGQAAIRIRGRQRSWARSWRRKPAAPSPFPATDA